MVILSFFFGHALNRRREGGFVPGKQGQGKEVHGFITPQA